MKEPTIFYEGKQYTKPELLALIDRIIDKLYIALTPFDKRSPDVLKKFLHLKEIRARIASRSS